MADTEDIHLQGNPREQKVKFSLLKVQELFDKFSFRILWEEEN